VVPAESTSRLAPPTVSEVVNGDENNITIYNFTISSLVTLKEITFDNYSLTIYGSHLNTGLWPNSLTTYVTPTASRKQNFGIIDEITDIWSFRTHDG
jgi:hypothetical protein